jgi:hypothetical protein
MGGKARADGAVGPFGFSVQQSKVPFRAGHGAEGLVVLIADDLDRVEKEIRQKEKHDQVSHFHVQPTLPAQCAKAAEQAPWLPKRAGSSSAVAE